MRLHTSGNFAITEMQEYFNPSILRFFKTRKVSWYLVFCILHIHLGFYVNSPTDYLGLITI